MIIEPHQVTLAIAASAKTRDEIAKEAKISVTALRRLEDGGKVHYDTVKAVYRVLSQYVEWLQPGDTASVATIEPKRTPLRAKDTKTDDNQ